MTGGAGMIIILVAIAIYFLPCVIAGCRGKRHGGFGIFLLTLCLGWTVVGWFAALIWASSGKTFREEEIERKRHRELLAALGNPPPAAPAPPVDRFIAGRRLPR